MAQKEAKANRKKMNTLELLYNKALMKEAAEKHDNVKKTDVKTWTDLHTFTILRLWIHCESF